MDNIQKINSNIFFKGMNKDSSPDFLGEGEYLHALNTVNNSDKGDLLKLGNEPSNFRCASFPYTYIGNIPLINKRYLIFSTNNTNSEIGIFEEQLCKYTPLINDSTQIKKIGFKITNIIKGVSTENWDCSESAYWNDGISPARMLNINNIPYVTKYKPDPKGGCDIEEKTSEIDIEKLRLTPFLKIPEITIKNGDSGGNLPDGAYRVAIAYSTDLIRVSDFLKVSDVQFIYSQTVQNGSIEVTVTNSDTNFKNYQLALISTVNQQTTARLLGIYPIEQKVVYIDTIKQDDKTLDLTDIPLQSVYYEGGDAIFQANDYIIQTGPRTRPEFNYQPQANKIRIKWVSYGVPENYYRKGGNKIGYTKGEIIPLFIRFVYNTGHRSSSIPLVGREASSDDKVVVNNRDSNAYGDGEKVQAWEIYDTSTITKLYPKTYDEEYPIAEGEMGYYESEDIYPDNKEVWGNLACTPIRHSKFPENCTVPNFDKSFGKIQILGLKLENISYPLDENKKPVKGVVGYEVLRGDKEGNKSVIAKGLIYNTGEYELPISYNNNKVGLYANYPFNDLSTDPYLSTKFPNGGCDGRGYQKVGTFNKQYFTFHSPETHFSNPSLPSYLKVEAEYNGKAQGYFEPVYNHPKHKLIRDFSLLLAATVGIGEGMLAIRGKTTKQYNAPGSQNMGDTAGVAAQAAGAPATSAWQVLYNQVLKTLKNSPVGSVITDLTQTIAESSGILIGTVPGAKGGSYTYSTEDTAFKNVPTFLKIGTNVVLFSYFFAQGTEVTLKIIKSIVPFRQHAFQCNMNGLYTSQVCPEREHVIRKIEDYSYLYSGVQNFQGYTINNNLRESSVLLKLNEPLNNPKLKDTSRQTIGTLKQWDNPSKSFETDISAHYVSIKRKLKNIYSQLESIRIVPTTSEIFPISESDIKSQTGIIFGGDTIIEEITLKRKNNLYTQNQSDGVLGNPNGYEFDYKMYPNILYPRYWMDTQEYDLTQLFNLSKIRLPNDSYYLDRDPNDCRRKVGFSVKNGYMYTSVNGIVRFYVESSYNLPFRKNHLTDITKKHFDKNINTNLSELFRSDVIKYDNYFEIDRSLSPIKQLNFTYSEILPREFSVKLNKCFTYEENKLIYSLPSNIETRTDNWRSFLVNNYFKFSKSDGRLVSVRNVNRTGVLYFFSSAPVKLHPGVDELQTENGLKIVVGDGGLFTRQPQSLTNTDHDFTECQSSEGIASTQYGVYFISQKQGKLFNYSGQIRDISAPIKFWLAKYLPSAIVTQYPDFELQDNTSIGVGCMATFDNINEIVYFSKIDYSVKQQYRNTITYSGANEFLVDGKIRIILGDPTYFDDASWTISYDPKANGGQGAYISFHDWHPNGIIKTNNHFTTIKDSSFWKHNEENGTYCNFYGVNYPWEIEYPFTNTQEVTTLESIEYQLQAFNNYNDQKDRYHILNENFDRAVIWNSEQCSGLLKLNMRVPNKPSLILNYPRYTPNGVEIEVTKQENKYRFNQFHDLTRNRGQFTFNWRTIWNTEENGYKRRLNTLNIDYNKKPFERKKIRHFSNVILLRKNISDATKFLLTLINNKSLKSFR